MRIYLKILSVLYFIGAVLHFLDVLDIRLKFSEMNIGWKIWVAALMVFDVVAAIGLWNEKRWGVAAFFTVAICQLIAYIGFQDFFGDQTFLIGFHIVTLAIFFGVLMVQKTAKPRLLGK